MKRCMRVHPRAGPGIQLGHRLIQSQNLLMHRFLPAEPGREMAALLHPEFHPAAQVSLRPGQFVVRNDLVPEARHLSQDRTDGGCDPVRIDPGRDDKSPRVGIVDNIGADVVGQALLLADGLEQTAAHAISEDGVKYLKCPGLWVISSQARDARSEERRVGKECRSRWAPY